MESTNKNALAVSARNAVGRGRFAGTPICIDGVTKETYDNTVSLDGAYVYLKGTPPSVVAVAVTLL